MIVIALVVFGCMYYSYGKKHRPVVITFCTVVPIVSLAVLIFCVFFRKKIELPLLPSSPKGSVSDLDQFTTRYEECVLQFAQSFTCLDTAGKIPSPQMRLYVLVETLSVAKTMMYHVPHLIDEDIISNLGSAVEKLEESLKIDCKAIFEGVNGETCEAV